MRTPKQLRNDRRLGRLAKARAKAKRKGKAKNPYYFRATKKGRKPKKTQRYFSKGELKKVASRKSQIDARVSKGAPRRGAKKKYKKAYQRVKARGKKFASALKHSGARQRRAVTQAAKLRKKGYKIKKIYVSEKAALSKKRKSKAKAKRKTTKKKGAKVAKKKKKTKKQKAAARKRARNKKKASGRKGKRRAIYLRPSRKSVTIRWKKNPSLAQLEGYTGFKAEELGSLLIGGAVYGTVDSLARKYLPAQVYSIAASIPVVGTTLVPALAGVGIKMLGDKFKIKAVSLAGEGIVGAAVVAMGIQASSLIPGLSGMGAVDFTRGPGVMNGYARDGADFGAVDYTPGMGMEPQMGLQPQMGRDPGDADFGEIPIGLGEIPIGLG